MIMETAEEPAPVTEEDKLKAAVLAYKTLSPGSSHEPFKVLTNPISGDKSLAYPIEAKDVADVSTAQQHRVDDAYAETLVRTSPAHRLKTFFRDQQWQPVLWVVREDHQGLCGGAKVLYNALGFGARPPIESAWIVLKGVNRGN